MVGWKKQVPFRSFASGSSSTYCFTRFSAIFLMLLVLFVLFSLSVFADTEGCYLYTGGSEDYLCQENVLESDAEADCLEYEDCDFDSMFIPGESCSNYPEICEEVTCSYDCDTHTIGKCEDLGGQEVADDEYDLWCTEGCCSIGSFCEYVDLRYDCVDRALQQGYSEDDITMIIDDIDPSSCQTDICGIDLEVGRVEGYIFDEEGDAISSATVELSSTESDESASDGFYSFSDVTPGSYVIQVSASGYSSSSTTISVDSGETVEANITLGEAGDSYSIDGAVSDDNGDIVSDVSICFESSSYGKSCTTSSSDGSYSISDLAADDYEITLTKYGYLTTTDSLTVSSDSSYDLTINSIDFQGVIGITYLDENGDGEITGSEWVVYGASIYVDDVYKGNSLYPDGDYELYLEEGDYVVYSTYQDYVSEEYDVSVTSGETVELYLVLSQEIGECSYGEENDQKAVEELSGSAAQGKAEVTLSWDKPCSEVSGYIIERDGEVWKEFSPLAISAEDTDVEWGESYTYSIWAVYTDGPLDADTGEPQVRLSESSADVTLELGSSDCEGRESGSTFCLFNDDDTSSDERKYVYSCDDDNAIVASTNCGSLDDDDSSYFCSSASETYALCKDAGSCSILGQSADPFGLYYDSETCYGDYDTEDGYSAFCYYDYTPSSIVDACYSCEQVTSCFDYVSEESCSINNCLGIGCSWIDSSNSSLDYGVSGSEEFLDYGYLFPTTPQTGHGYCAPDEYGDDEESGFDDYCNLCGPEADLFENNYCTADVCSNLGRCFADSELIECNGCGDTASSDANCYEYNSELECTGDRGISINSGAVTGSEDSCSWNVCAWQDSSASSDDESSEGEGVNGYCYKDGNADEISDCSEFSSGEYDACVKDVYPPETSIVTESFEVVSTAYPNVTFEGIDDSNPLGQLGYCLMSSDSSDCDNFEYVDYDGLESTEEMIVDLIDSSFLSSSEIDGESYVLRYFSVDKYYNQESVIETIVFVDNHLPEYSVEWESTTEGDISELFVYLSDMNEQMDCEFGLEETYPSGDEFESSATRDEDKETTFSDLDGIIYNLTVSCTDDYGNLGEYDEEIVFDLEQDITIVYPEYDGVVAETSISFSIETAVSASCELYDVDSGEKLADFVSSDDENKVHETEEVSGFYEGDYSGTTKVVCVESLDGDILEDYFYFSVDFTAPGTQIILTEGERVEEPSGYNWEEFFVETVQVDFECDDDDGFTCSNTYYCLGEGCEYSEAEGYLEYTASAELTESTEICYYSVDEAGSVGYPDCGEILIEGFGIILVSPTQYYYEEEVWGVSNTPTFDWELMTKIDTTSCTFDFNSGFDVDSQPEYKQIPEHTEVENHYLYSDFPGDVLEEFDEDGNSKTLYVACVDYLGEVGPDQLMHLEYDPTAPEIESSYTDPDSLSEGVETYLYTSTDDKTLCKFSDDSDGEGSVEFDTMEYAFPGFDADDYEQELFIDHETSFSFSFSGASKDYLLNVQCMNGAGDVSESTEVEFTVDYSATGYIVSVSPEGYVSETDITLEVETSKNGECSFDEVVIESTGSTSHSQSLGTLEEGEYQYLIVCSIEGSDRETEATFTVDYTAPTVTEVDDGSYSCSLDTASLLVYTDDESISSYYYELYEGEAVEVEDSTTSDENSTDSDNSDDSSVSTSGGTLITSGTLPAEDGTSITDLSLSENTSYYFEVSATDEAGNAGSSTTSDGFIAVEAESELCSTDETEPTITVSTESSCTDIDAEITCEDDLGCSSILYGADASSSECEYNETYYGSAISFDSSGWLCYYAEDVTGNNVTGSTKITFSDDDGDGIEDSCDICSSTSSGSAVDDEGCGYGEEPDSDEASEDDDGDGLPNSWEQLYDSTGCSFDYQNSDSDDDGTLDTNEDYDDDGYTSYEEYKSGYDPCVSDGPEAEDAETDADDTDADDGEADTTTETEGVSIVGLLFLVLGLLLVIGGAGGLYFAYTKDPNGKAAFAQFFGRGQVAVSRGPPVGVQDRGFSGPSIGSQRSFGGAPSGGVSQTPARSSFFSGLRRSVEGLGKVKLRKSKRKERKGVFGTFNKSTPNFPHIDDVIQSRKSPMEKLGTLTSRYSEHHDVIQKGLQKHEKSLFDQLDTITTKAANKPLHKVANEEDAKDIFKKLKKLSNQRGS